MSDIKRLIESKSTIEDKLSRTFILSLILILVLSGSELACRYKESEFICKTLCSSVYGSHKESGKRILRNRLQKIYRVETLPDRIKLSGKESQVIYRRSKKKGIEGKIFRPELSNCYLWFYGTGRLYNSCTTFVIYFWLSLFSIIIYIHCQDGKKKSLQLS